MYVPDIRNEAKVAGVDFDGIVRAVLKGQDVGKGGSGKQWWWE